MQLSPLAIFCGHSNGNFICFFVQCHSLFSKHSLCKGKYHCATGLHSDWFVFSWRIQFRRKLVLPLTFCLVWAVVVAELVEQSLLIPEVRSSNLVIRKIYFEHFFSVNCIKKTKIKKKEAGEWPIFKKHSSQPKTKI